MDTGMRTTKTVLTEGGWIWWLGQLRSADLGASHTIAELLQLYIKGVKWEDVQ